MIDANPQQRQLEGLALLLQLQRKARHCEDTTALAFTIVNETRNLLEYRQAALSMADPGTAIVAVSGVALIESHAPYLVWLKSLAQWVLRHDAPHQTFTASDVPPELATEWQDWVAPHAVWVSLGNPNFGGLLLFRDYPWRDAELTLLTELCDAYAHAWQALQSPVSPWRKWIFRPRRRGFWLLPLVLLIPIRQSVLAPAEVVAIDPTLIRAPVDGVVADFQIRPNQIVEPGQPLLNLENIDIVNRLDIARKSLAVAEAEYRSNAQLAVVDNKSKTDLAVLKTRIDQHQAEVSYLSDQLARTQISAPHPGIALFTDPQDWLGKPVTLGERILQLADPRHVQLAIRLPVADLIELPANADVVMFLNSDPQNPLKANLHDISYQAEAGPDDILAYRLRARLSDDITPPRIGLKGSAKVYGYRVTLFYYLFRRPLAELRLWLGL